MFGKCVVCDEKDRRIDDLKAHLTELRRLVFPEGRQDTLPIVEIEAGKVLDGSSDVLELTNDEVSLEANEILTGTY